MGVSKGYITKWKKRYAKKGIVALLLGYKGPNSYLTHEQQYELVEWLKSEKSWCLEEVIEHIEQKYGVVFKSKQSYYKFLKKAGIGWKKSQVVNPKKNPEKVDEKRKEIKVKMCSLEEEIKNGEVRVFFQDESHLLWGNIVGYVWAKYAERISIPITNTKEKVTYYCASRPLGGWSIRCDNKRDISPAIFIRKYRKYDSFCEVFARSMPKSTNSVNLGWSKLS